MQGDAGGAGGGPDAYMRDTNASVLCTVKHFAAYGRGTGGIDGSPAVISPQLLNEVYLRPWRALAAAGLLRSVMAGQNAVNGVPMHAHAALLGPNGTLRHAWGVARALVESDGADCIGALMDFRVVATREDAAVLAVTAGVDVDLGALTLPLLVNASAKGKLPVEALDRAVGDVLTAKFSSGLFDGARRRLAAHHGGFAPAARHAFAPAHLHTLTLSHPHASPPAAPYADPARLNPATLDPPASRALAREAATQSLTLLRNLDGLLPLQLSRGGQRVALLGLNANSTDALKGGYAQDGQLMVTVLAAFRAALGASVSFALGADPDAVVANETRLAEAVALAAASDVAVLVLGDSLTSCGEMYDTASFALAGAEQEALLARVAALAPRVKVVLVLLHARPVTFGGARGDALLSGVGALLAGFRLGEEGGSAVYDVVTGAANPSGKLPQAWPRSVGQVFGPASPYLYPFQGNHMYENYTDAPSSPLFAFGAGLSFSQWALADASATRGANGFAVRVTLRNVGARDGSQTVFVFAEDVICSVVRVASRQLVAFEKAGVPAGGSAALLLDVPLERLAVWIEAAGDWVLEPGEFVFYVALEGPGAQGAFPPSTIAVRVTV